MAVTHREMEDATLSGKQVKINKNRFYFLLAPYITIFLCVYMCLHSISSTNKKKKFAALTPRPSLLHHVYEYGEYKLKCSHF